MEASGSKYNVNMFSRLNYNYNFKKNPLSWDSPNTQ